MFCYFTDIRGLFSNSVNIITLVLLIRNKDRKHKVKIKIVYKNL